MRDECNQILKYPTFRNAPVLSRLLLFLVDETVAGHGNALKSYTVAVEGLGRAEDFDSYADSYPRVQVGRLRRALENHYAQHAPANGLCLYLQLGSYRLRLANPAAAYPNLYRPLSAHQNPEVAKLLEGPDRVRPPVGYDKHEGSLSGSTSSKLRLFLAAALIAALAMGVYISRLASHDFLCVLTLPSSPWTPMSYTQILTTDARAR